MSIASPRSVPYSRKDSAQEPAVTATNPTQGVVSTARREDLLIGICAKVVARMPMATKTGGDGRNAWNPRRSIGRARPGL
jgi:hypothetical protein